jgi:hypothetical protein
MIRANTRGRLTAADLQLVILLLSRGSAHRRVELERRLMAEGPDSLLDAPELFERLLTVRSMLLPSEALFFYVVVRHALRASDLNDREVADYLSAMLLEFGDRRFKVMVHLGNYALWLSGLFPDYIAARRLRKAGPDVAYYEALGSRGFGLASDHALAEEYGLDAVLRTAAERFPALRSALNAVSDRLLFPFFAH